MRRDHFVAARAVLCGGRKLHSEGRSGAGVTGVSTPEVGIKMGENRCDGRSFGGGEEKNVVKWFSNAVRALFKLVRILDWSCTVKGIFNVDDVNYC